MCERQSDQGPRGIRWSHVGKRQGSVAASAALPEYKREKLAEYASQGSVSLVVAQINLEGLSEEHSAMLLVTEWLRRVRIDRLLVPSETRYFSWNSQTFLGKGPNGSIVVKDEDGLFLIANDFAEKLLDTILREVVAVLGISKYEEQEAD